MDAAGQGWARSVPKALASTHACNSSSKHRPITHSVTIPCCKPLTTCTRNAIHQNTPIQKRPEEALDRAYAIPMMAVHRYTYLLSKCVHTPISTCDAYTPPPHQVSRAQPVLTRLPFRRLDPVFAIAVGSAAAALRVRRDEQARGQSVHQTVETLKRRIYLVWNGRSQT